MEVAKLFELIKTHPLTERFTKEKETEVNLLRRKAIADKEQQKEEFSKENSIFDAELAKSEKTIKIILIKLDLARRERSAIVRRRYNCEVAHNYAVVQNEHILRTSYPKTIDEFISKVHSKIQEISNHGISIISQKGKENIFTGSRPNFASTNLRAVGKATAYLRTAIREAEELKMADLEGVDVDGELDRLWRGIPATSEFEIDEQIVPENISILKRHVEKPRTPRG